jgi:translation initiation factor 3 subunit M
LHKHFNSDQPDLFSFIYLQEEGSKLVETSGSLFVDQCKASYAAEKYADLLEQFASNLDILFSKAANDQDLEGAINIICHLVPRIPVPGAGAAATRLASALAATPTVRPDRRLQALVNLYNVVWETQSKYTVLLQTLAFSKASGLADVMLNVVRTHADTWAAGLSLTPADERNLYVACADALRGCTRKPKTAAKEAYRLLCKYLVTFEGTGAAEAATGAAVASQVVSDYLKSPDLFHFDLADNPAIAALASNSQFAPLHQLLTIYLTGTVADFKSFAKSNGAVFQSLGVTEDAAAAKMKLLALMGLAHGSAEIKFAEIASSLDLPAGEVESVVVQAIGKRLMEAKIDQLEEVVTVTKCAPRTFGAAQWQELLGQLKSWKQSVGEVMELGKDEKSVLSKGISELSVGA